MKVSDLSLSAKGKQISLTGTIGQMILNDNGAVDLVLNTDNGTIRVWFDADATANYDVKLSDAPAPTNQPNVPAPSPDEIKK